MASGGQRVADSVWRTASGGQRVRDSVWRTAGQSVKEEAWLQWLVQKPQQSNFVNAYLGVILIN